MLSVKATTPIFLALLNAAALLRKLIEEGGQRYLVPLNPTYPKALFTEECRIIGVVVQATAKF